jgi:hypothetical protein
MIDGRIWQQQAELLRLSWTGDGQIEVIQRFELVIESVTIEFSPFDSEFRGKNERIG